MIKFTKMHGAGNDYVYVDLFRESLMNPAELAIMVSPRHHSIGSDGLITIGPSACESAVAKMTIYNADGSKAQMCGNGIRCVAKYVYDEGYTKDKTFDLDTDAGVKTVSVELNADDKVVRVTVDMGELSLDPAALPCTISGDSVIDYPITTENGEYTMNFTCVSVGNPHAVTFVEDVNTCPLELAGPMYEDHKVFPERVNVEFCHIISRNEVDMRVWERGSGETFACGTGGAATAYACIVNGLTDDDILMHLKGGDLIYRFDRETGHMMMTGPAERVFDGVFYEN